MNSLSCVRLFATPWTAAHQAPPSMGFSRQEYWSGVPLPSPTGLVNALMVTFMCRLDWVTQYPATWSDILGFPGGSDGKAPANAGDLRDMGSVLGLGRSPGRRAWQPTPVFLPGQSHGWRSLMGLHSMGSQRVRHNLSTEQQLGRRGCGKR